MIALLITGAMLLSCSSSKEKLQIEPEAAPTIKVDANQVVWSRTVNPMGVNLNYLRDPDVLRAPGAIPLKEALKDFNGKWLRYPGGKKSNYYRFALPPYQEVNTQTLGWYQTERKADVMDFDEYVDLVKEVNANGYVVVAYDRERINDKTTTLQEYIDHAVAWVNYAKSKGTKVKYWEIGNENWINFKGSTWMEVVKDVGRIAAAMKQADPSIKLGTNFDNEGQLHDMLRENGKNLDFVSCSNYYPGTKWGNLGYKFYEENNNVGMLMLYDTFQKVTRELGLNLEFVLAECNAKQWEGSWTDNNDIGHGLVSFDICAQVNQAPKITTAMFWNTSWFDTLNNSFNLLNDKNELRSNAQAVKLWNDFWKPHAVKTENTLGLVSYAVKNDQGALTLFVINKTGVEKKTAIQITSKVSFTNPKVYNFAGKSGKDTDVDTGIKELAGIDFTNNKANSATFAPYSITVIDLK